MLLCHACNTRFEDGSRACPSCGRRASEHATEAVATGPGSSGSTGPLPPSGRLEKDVGIDLELDEQDVIRDRPSGGRTARSRRKPQPPSSIGRARESGSAMLGLDSRQVRVLVCEQPGLLEKGLGVHADDDGQPIGIDFETPQGDIDLLARDKKGNLVVVMIPERGELDDVVSAVLQRIGWVRKHLSDDEDVRGIVVAEQLPETVSYAAAGVAGMVAFKAFRVALTFHDITP